MAEEAKISDIKSPTRPFGPSRPRAARPFSRSSIDGARTTRSRIRWKSTIGPRAAAQASITSAMATARLPPAMRPRRQSTQRPAGHCADPGDTGPVCIAYNLPGLKAPLKLSGATLAGIFSSEIISWQDPSIARENPGVALPHQAIIVRSSRRRQRNHQDPLQLPEHVSPSLAIEDGQGPQNQLAGGHCCQRQLCRDQDHSRHARHHRLYRADLCPHLWALRCVHPEQGRRMVAPCPASAYAAVVRGPRSSPRIFAPLSSILPPPRKAPIPSPASPSS